MRRRTFILAGSAAFGMTAVTAGMLHARQPEDPARLIKGPLATSVRNYHDALKKAAPKRYGKKDKNRKQVVHNFGTGSADAIDRQLVKRTRSLIKKANLAKRSGYLKGSLDKALEKHHRFLKKARSDLERRKKRIDAEIKRRAAERKRHPEKSQNVGYNRALEDESRFLGKLIANIKKQEATTAKALESTRKAQKEAARRRQKQKKRYFDTEPPKDLFPDIGAPLNRD